MHDGVCPYDDACDAQEENEEPESGEQTAAFEDLEGFQMAGVSSLSEGGYREEEYVGVE